jgi:hypothetical protein
MWRYSRRTLIHSAGTAEWTVARASKEAGVVLGVVWLEGLDLAANRHLVGSQDLFNMTHKVRTRAVLDVARVTVELADWGTLANCTVGSVREASGERTNELEFNTWV